tara:strand:- start:791 stop:1054 length:264 start_codon:yes stop_codon:yes gene_type:complete
MKYKFGDIVKVAKAGIHKDEEATIVEVNPMIMPNQNYYTVKLRNKQTKIIINEKDIRPINLVKNDKCECGGSKLTIPHHYDWCPESK